MTTAEAPLGIYVNDQARPRCVREAEKLAAAVPDTIWKDLHYPEPAEIVDANVSLVIGGDWSANIIMRGLIRRGYPGIFVVAPGGSQNGLFETLKAGGAVVHSNDIINNSFSHVLPFRPGMINNNPENIFNHAVALGQIAWEHALTHRRIRMSPILPREWPMFLAAMSSVLNRMSPEAQYSPDVIRLLLTQHRLGPFGIGIESLVLDSPDLYLLELNAHSREQLMSSLMTLFKQILNKKKLREISGITIGSELPFPFQAYGNIDGDWRAIEPAKGQSGRRQGVLYAGKTDQTILSGALVP